MLVVRDLRRSGLGPLSFSLETGECLAVTGPSGAGKSLLLRAIADLDPNDGEVSLDDDRREDMSGPAWRRLVAYLPAEPGWWDDSVKVHFQDWPAAARLTEQLLLDPTVAERPIPLLSTGERQRLALLRLLCQRPTALLLDEPTASLDPENVRRVERFVSDERRARQIPVLWVSHDPRQMRRVADRHFRILEGKLVEAAL